jgi:hypothetical protein
MISGRVPGFVTKGDANKMDDIPIAEGSVVGKVVWHVPYLGHAMQWSKTWLGISILVYLPAVILFWDEIRRLRDYFKKSMPYRLYKPQPQKSHSVTTKYIAASVVAVLLVGAAFVPAAFALVQTNTVTLSANTLTSAGQPAPPGGGNCANNTNVHINNSSTQDATSGSASSTGNTNGGSATSGNASNTNSTNINVNISGC